MGNLWEIMGSAHFRMFQMQVQNADELLEKCMQEHGGVSDFNNLAPSKGYDLLR